VRCCAADVFGKLRGPVARAVLRASVCERERESTRFWFVYMYLSMKCTAFKLSNVVPLVD